MAARRHAEDRAAAVNTVVLLSSSGFVWLAERAVQAGRRPRAVAALAVALALGTAFALVQLHEWRDHPYGPTAHLYGSLYFTITGFHLAHVVAEPRSSRCWPDGRPPVSSAASGGSR